MGERLKFLGVPDDYHSSLGRFIDMFSRVKLAFFSLAKKTNVPLAAEQAIFSDAWIDKARDTINRIRAAHGVLVGGMFS
jgi:hypothetical protein